MMQRYEVFKITPKTWVVAKQYGPSVNLHFDREEDADTLADALNHAYDAGRADVQNAIRGALGLSDVGD